MKRIITLCIALFTIGASYAQIDTTQTNPPPHDDTIRIGGMIIIRKAGSKDKEVVRDKEYKMNGRDNGKRSNLKTNWWIIDLGFSNYKDESNYTTALASGFVSPGVGKDQMKLRSGKSRNVNLWFFMQKLNMVEHVVNLKYGLGLELNNYHFDDNIAFTKNPTNISLSANDMNKRKLAMDYLTVPMMLNFDFTPKKKRGFGLSAGVSAGYLYSARYKTKDGGKKEKLKDDYDLERFKLSYVAELSLGPVKLYGSMAMKNMWEKGLDMTPYNFGFRLSNF